MTIQKASQHFIITKMLRGFLYKTKVVDNLKDGQIQEKIIIVE
jgi:hypothetical protein